MVYALFELHRPKDKAPSGDVKQVLDAFHPKSEDIDNLILNFDDSIKVD